MGVLELGFGMIQEQTLVMSDVSRVECWDGEGEVLLLGLSA